MGADALGLERWAEVRIVPLAHARVAVTQVARNGQQGHSGHNAEAGP